ncbi:hypothetical protein HOF51_01385 [bacterium]|nr:hypothetical protein [bacterium]MBT6130876.1 hypothetical protein [bacterium]
MLFLLGLVLFARTFFAFIRQQMANQARFRKLIFFGAVFFWTAVTTLLDSPDLYASGYTTTTLSGKLPEGQFGAMRRAYVGSLVLGEQCGFIVRHNAGDALCVVRERVQHSIAGSPDRVKSAYNKLLAYANRGRKTCHSVFSGTHQYQNDQQESRLKDVIELVWGLYDKALSNRQSFYRGMFVLKDPGFRVYNFLRDYVDRFGAQEQSCAGYVSFNQFAYPRVSTHFVNAAKAHQQYGIDVRFGSDGSRERLLPAGKTHLLFGMVDKGQELIFIKPEDAGLYLRDGWITHVMELGLSIGRRCGLSFMFGSDEDPYMRVENTPKLFVNRYWSLLKDSDSGLVKSEAQQYFDIVKAGGGISALIKDCIQFVERQQGSKTWRDRIGRFIAQISDGYDRLENRFGGEVVILPSDFCAKP